jgi:hypothetical protein
MGPPGRRTGPEANRAGEDEAQRPASGKSAATLAAPVCSYCDVVYVRVNRRVRRWLAQMGRVAPEWLAAHTDQCPTVILGAESGIAGWMAAGRTRSPFRRGGA